MVLWTTPRPSNNLIRCADDAGISLLLHEATFDDDDRGKKEALQKRRQETKDEQAAVT